MLSKKYYRMIAEVLAIYSNPEDLIDRLCRMFKQDNPRFDEERFRGYIKLVEGNPISCLGIDPRGV